MLDNDAEQVKFVQPLQGKSMMAKMSTMSQMPWQLSRYLNATQLIFLMAARVLSEYANRNSFGKIIVDTLPTL
jgi:hypothetical protein